MGRIRVSLDFKSPLLIGGKKSSSNFINSDDVIKGSVVRAAFAKIILGNCPVSYISKEKANWVFKRNKECCETCKFKSVCEKFANIKFSYFYPKESEVIPLTSMICKTNKEHGFIDCLVDDKECKECGSGGRVEFTSGLRTINKKKIPFKVEKSVSVKTAINPYSKTSADGMLYSIETITATGTNKLGKKECIYEGIIEGLSVEELDLFKTIRVGGDTTVGLGKCTVNCIKESGKSLESIEYGSLKKFSDKYRIRNYPKSKLNFIAIKFVGDLKVDFKTAEDEFKAEENIKDDYLTTDQYKKVWEKALGITEDYNLKIDKIYTEIINYRGYDTSKTSEDKRANILTLAVKGTVIVFASEESVENMCSALNSKKSEFGFCFGNDTENGFGEYVLYDGR